MNTLSIDTSMLKYSKEELIYMLDVSMTSKWKTIDQAPKIEGLTESGYHWILGFDGREQKVIRWTTEYPRTDGCWMLAYAPNDYIDDIQGFHPTHYMELPSTKGLE